MFPTFTGNSRRTRNINLSSGSGQRTGWGASSQSGGSGLGSSASRAQAERQHRQQDRRRIDAAKLLQRVWRSHRVRRVCYATWRAEFDSLYDTGNTNAAVISPSPPNEPHKPHKPNRAQTTLPLLLLFFNKTKDDDVSRLLRWMKDVGPGFNLDTHHLQALFTMLFEALEVEVTARSRPERCTELLHFANRITEVQPGFLKTQLERYYNLLAQLCRNTDPALGTEAQRAILRPLAASNDPELVTRAHDVFVCTLLGEAGLPVLEGKLQDFSPHVNTSELAQAVCRLYAAHETFRLDKEARFNVLANFIYLTRTATSLQERLVVAEALYQQLASLSLDIKTRIKAPEASSDLSNGDLAHQPFRPHVSRALLSLCDQEAISDLFVDFARSGSAQEAWGTLAGYISILLRCFPTQQGDGIRMNLYLQDVPTTPNPLPVVIFFWRLMRQGAVLKSGLAGPHSVIRTLRDYLSGIVAPTSSLLNQDWRVVLLFLELYTFILRLSDDEDFLCSLDADGAVIDKLPPTRLRLCNLSRNDVNDLSLMLKGFAFALHYRSRDLNTQFFTDPTRLESAGGAGQPGLAGLREIVTSALRLIYERDSRLHFFGPTHWLLPDFSIQSFVADVVAEEQKRQDDDEADDEISENDDMDLGPVDHASTAVMSRATADLIRRARIEQGRSRMMPGGINSKRSRSEVDPALAILRNMPFGIPFEARVDIFKRFVLADRFRRRGGMESDGWHAHSGSSRKHSAMIRRGHVFEDAFEAFWALGDGLKEPLSISFRDQFDNDELGVDGGGVTKEFLTSFIDEAFGPDYRMFVSNKEGLLYPNPSALEELRYTIKNLGYGEGDVELVESLEKERQDFEFLGRIVGKCMYEGILIDAAFAPFFLLKWAAATTGEGSYKGDINDLRDMDEELYNGLLRVKNYPGDITDLDMTFTLDDRISPPDKPAVTVTRNLRPGGDSMPVNNDNRLLYMWYVARHRLVSQPRVQTDAFLRGLRSIIHPSWLSMFNQTELGRLVGGDSREIDIADLRRHTEYSGVYAIGDDGLEHPTIVLFWEVLEEMADGERREVLRYVTSTPRAPLLGFSQLWPRFTIRDSTNDASRLPSASTCVNLLKLPIYREKETLQNKLRQAITSGAGFGFS